MVLPGWQLIVIVGVEEATNAPSVGTVMTGETGGAVIVKARIVPKGLEFPAGSICLGAMECAPFASSAASHENADAAHVV